MAEYIKREALVAYIREQSEEWQKAFEELGGESGIYADAYNDLAEDFYRIPAADVAPVVRCKDCKYDRACLTQSFVEENSSIPFDRETFYCADAERKENET